MKNFVIENERLMSEWNWEENNKLGLNPSTVTCGSGKKAFWICKNGHSWQASIDNRNKGRGCPYCANKLVLKGFNDLATINPELAKEWNYDKNGNLKPDMVTANSNKKVWWKCKKGHEWQATIANRNRGTGCPDCAKELQTSFPEQAIYFYVKKLFPDAINGDNHLGMELDIYIPSKKVALEYDGAFWHKNRKRDEKKVKLCKENNIFLIRVKENENSEIIENENIKLISCDNSDEGLKKAIILVVQFLGKNINVDLNSDRVAIYTSFIYGQKQQSLQVLNPKLAEEWNYEKNRGLKPDMVKVSSGKKVWWKCKKGHEWQATIASRNKGSGCSICANQQVLKGYNDLATINSKLAKEWNYEKNVDLPDMFTANSHKKVWWKCEQGHEWQATIGSRNRGNGCPTCAKAKRKKRI